MDFTIDEPLTVASVASWLTWEIYNHVEGNERKRENTALNVYMNIPYQKPSDVTIFQLEPMLMMMMNLMALKCLMIWK